MRAWLEADGFRSVFNGALILASVVFVLPLLLYAVNAVSAVAALLPMFSAIVLVIGTAVIDNYLWWKFARGGGASWL